MSKIQSTKRILSGTQPTNIPHIGNFFGAFQNYLVLQKDFDALYFVADLHAITVRQDPKQLKQLTLDLYALYLAIGLDPARSIIFVQSHVPAHSELSWLLSCFTQFGELSRMTQFKDKSQKHADNVNAGLFTYPVLMAADILIYDSDLVPVGADQKQHLEIARNIAERVNGVYGADTLVLPEPYTNKLTAKIQSLSEPDKKMSKSDPNPNATVTMLDSRDVIIKKFKRAVTDSETLVQYREDDPAKAGVNNLMSIYAAATGKTMPEIEREFDGKGYGAFKVAVGEAVADLLEPIQTEHKRLTADKAYVTACMKDGAAKAAVLADKTVRRLRGRIGFLPL
jgi:tryptophanyl-tRNA synthetase